MHLDMLLSFYYYHGKPPITGGLQDFLEAPQTSLFPTSYDK